MRQSTRLALTLVMIITMAFALSGCGLGARTEGTETGFVGGTPGLTRIPPAERKPAPQIVGRTLDDKELRPMTAYPGKVIVINVWGSWCAPCRAEVDDLVSAAQRTKKIAAFVGINTQDPSPAAARAFERANKVTYPSLYDPDGSLLVQFQPMLSPRAIPTTLLIDKQGRMAARWVGQIGAPTLVGLINEVAELS